MSHPNCARDTSRTSFRFKILASIFTIVFLFLLGSVENVSAQFKGDTGASGANGESGDPATHGTGGGNGEDTIFFDLTPGDLPHMTVGGGDGGDGGAGGRGIDGGDEDGFAIGGNGGNGGRGGISRVNLKLSRKGSVPIIFSQGGFGGNGGRPGQGSTAMHNGVGGRGGEGGASDIFFLGQESSSLGSHGGYGGNAFGIGAAAGKGGFASITASSGTNLTLTGGRGGTGINGASGGDGANSTFGLGSSTYVNDPSAPKPRSRFQVSVSGGAGGDARGGFGGAGGMAGFGFAGLKNPALNFQARVFGGHGGKGSAISTEASNGGAGGDAFFRATPSTTLIDNRDANINLSMFGGIGGSTAGAESAGTGGHGGNAHMEGRQVFSVVNSPTGNMRVNVEAAGGAGGHGSLTGMSGNGGNASIENNFRLQARRYGELEVKATGGDGGWRRNNGSGGDASIIAEETFGQPTGAFINPNSTVRLLLTASGGNAGRGMFMDRPSANGGDAKVIAQEVDSRSIETVGRSIAGHGNLGNSGEAFTRVSAIVERGAQTPVTPNTARATAHANPAAGTITGRSGGQATNSVAIANAYSDYGYAFANSNARGGFGVKSGNANARSIANGSFWAASRAYSHSLGDNDAESENYSNAESTAISRQTARANSVASSTGLVEYASAFSTAGGKRTTASAIASNETTSWKSNTKVALTSSYLTNPAGTASSRANVRVRSGDFNEAGSTTVAANVNIIPDQAQADQFVVNNSDLASAFVDDDEAFVMATGSIFGGMHAGDVGQLAVSGSLDFAFESRDWFGGNQLLLGLVNLENEGRGFDFLDLEIKFGESVVFNDRFEDNAAAMTRFDSNLFVIGDTPVEGEMLDFNIDFTMGFSDAADQFGFGFIVGDGQNFISAGDSEPLRFTAVPEPGSVVVLGLMMLAGLGRRRRK